MPRPGVGRGALLVAMALAITGCRQGPSPPANFLLITIDTLRADHLGCYGYAPAVTPNIDRLAKSGILFEAAIAQAPVTLPSHASLLTGTYPPAHGVRDNVTYRVSAQSLTLAEVLKERGYETGAFIGAYPLKRQFGLDQGFSWYDDRLESQRDTPRGFFAERRAERVVAAALDWLRRTENRRFFCWVHLFDPHVPYDPPSPFKERLREPYDGEIAYVDSELGKLLQGLDQAGLAEKTLVVLTADHGESLGQHGERSHGLFIYDATLRVPLVFHHPSLREPRRLAGQVPSVDVMPTVLDLLGIPVPGEVQGESLREALAGHPIHRPAYAETYVPLVNFHWSRLVGLRLEGWKYIEAPRPELYDLTHDPGEVSNLFEAEPERAASLRGELLAMEKRFSREEKRAARLSPDEKTREALRSLGYLGGDLPEVVGDSSLPDPKDRIRTWDLMEEELLHLTSQRYREAVGVLGRILKEDPDNLLALEHLGYCQFHLGEIREAERAYRRLLALDPRRASAHVSLGSCLERLGNRMGAREHFKRAQELDPTHARAYNRMGYAMLEEGHSREAQGQFQKALELEPESADSRKGLARAYRQMGDLDKARALYKELTDESADADALGELAELLLAQGHQKDAENAIGRALGLEPEHWKALYVRSVILTQSGDETSARNLLEQVVKSRPNFAQAHHDLAVIYARQGDDARAVAAYQQAIRLAPNALSHNGVGAVHARAGRWAAAIEQFKKAIEMKPDYDAAYENLGQAYLAQGLPEEAEATLRKLKQLRSQASR